MLTGTVEGRLPRDARVRHAAPGGCSSSAPTAATRRCRWPRRPAAGRADHHLRGLRRARRLRPAPHRRQPYADRIEIRRGPALETIASARRARSTSSSSTPTSRLRRLLRGRRCRCWPTDGLIAVDNTLWSGRVADPRTTDETTERCGLQRQGPRRPARGQRDAHRARRGDAGPTRGYSIGVYCAGHGSDRQDRAPRRRRRRRRGIVVATQPVRVPVQPAVLGPGAASVHHA